MKSSCEAKVNGAQCRTDQGDNVHPDSVGSMVGGFLRPWLQDGP